MSNYRSHILNTSTAWFAFYFFSFFFVYLLSTYLLDLYIYGDQEKYTELYYIMRGISLDNALLFQKKTTGSSEPFYGYLIWFVSNAGLDKTFFISIINGVFAVLVALTVRKMNGSMFIPLAIYTNYYFIVLITAAERLKFSYILFCIAILVGGRIGTGLLLVSPLVHLQSVVTIASLTSARILSQFSSQKNGLLYWVKLFIGLCIATSALLYILSQAQDSLADKYDSYTSYEDSTSQGLLEFLQISVLGSVALIIARNRLFTTGLFLPLVPAVALVGGTRVNMIAFTLLLFVSLKDGRSLHPLMIALYAYFTFKSLGFVSNIITYGVGYLGQS